MIKTPQLVKKCICIWSINLCKSIGNQIKFEKPPDPNLMKTTKTKWKPTKNGQCLDETLSSIEVAPSLFEQFLPTVNTQYVIGVLERHPKCFVGQLRNSFFLLVVQILQEKVPIGLIPCLMLTLFLFGEKSGFRVTKTSPALCPGAKSKNENDSWFKFDITLIY